MGMETLFKDPRQQRGLVLSGASRLKRIVDSTWLVPSQSHAGSYLVDQAVGSCTCPDHELRGTEVVCKHRWAVEFVRSRVAAPEGESIEKTMKPTYRQDWAKYNAAQTKEKQLFLPLLRALCDRLQNDHQTFGRPRAAVSDVVFAAALKTFVGLSGRRSQSDLEAAKNLGFLDSVPSYNSIFDYMGRPEMTPILRELVRVSATPMRMVETQFAIDGTGFSSTVYARWYDQKYGREKKEAKFVKLHAVVGTLTNVITSVEVTDSNVAESPLLPSLLVETSRGFNLSEVSADKGYLSRKNLAAVESLGATPYIAFKENSQGRGPDAWERAYCSFSLHRAAWLDKYHRRSNVESTFGALKKKFAGSVRAKTETAMLNEVLLKCVCYNISCLIHALFELGIDPTFEPGGVAA